MLIISGMRVAGLLFNKLSNKHTCKTEWMQLILGFNSFFQTLLGQPQGQCDDYLLTLGDLWVLTIHFWF